MKNNKRFLLLFSITICFQFLFAQEVSVPQTDKLPQPHLVLESTFTVPTAFSSALDSLVFSYYAIHARKGKCKKMGTENIEYSDSIYKKRLETLPNEIGMPFNSAVKSFIEFYVGKKRNQVEKMLGLSKYYFPIFEDALNGNDIPMEFRILPVIESALNTNAVSRVGASGLWQFMPSTGKMYGLEVNSLVDERCDPIKSTYAAVHYIKDLYRIYGDWHMAIAAYNCGPGTVNKAIRRSGGKRDYWSIYPYLPAETRSYVPIFIAANYVMTYYPNHNLCPAEIDMPVYTDTVLVTQRVCFAQISKVLSIPIEELRILNPQYRKSIIPGSDSREYYLRLPTHYASKFIELKDSIYASCPEELLGNVKEKVELEQAESTINNQYTSHRHKKISYKVRRGDTLTGIANKYNVDTSDIKRWNGIRKNKIQIGQRLTIRR